MKQQILSLGKDSLVYGVGSVITRFIGLLLLPIFTAYLTPEEYGVLAMLALLVMVAQPVFSLGLSAAMGPSYFEGDNPLTKSKAVWTAFAINSVSATLLVAVAWLFPELLGRLVRLPAEYTSLVRLSLTGCALTILSVALTQRVQFEKQARLYVTVTVATALTAILVSVVTVVYLGWGVRGMVIGQLAGNTVTFLAFLSIGLKATKPALNSAMARELLRLGFPLIPGFAFLFILMHANKYILEWHAGLNAVGIYSIGFNLGSTINIVTSGFAAAWYPFFMSYMDRQSEARVIFGRIFTYYVFGAGFLCLVFFLAAKPVVVMLTQEAFHEAAAVIGFVALANFFQVAFNLFLPGLYFNKEIKYVSIVQGIAAVIALMCNFFLIRYYGVLGAGIGLALGNLLMAGLLYGWNQINAARYPVINYEWGRIGLFMVVAATVLSIYALFPVSTTLGEIGKSLMLVTFSLAIVLLLIDSREQVLLRFNKKRTS